MSIWFSETNGCISNCYLLRTSSHCPLNKTHQENSLLSSFFLHPQKKQLVFLLVCPHDFTVVARSWTGVRCSWGLFFFLVALTFEALDIMIFNRTRAGNSLRMGSLLFFSFFTFINFGYASMKILLRRRGRPGSIFRHGMLLSSRGIGHGISAEKNELRFFSLKLTVCTCKKNMAQKIGNSSFKHWSSGAMFAFWAILKSHPITAKYIQIAVIVANNAQTREQRFLSHPRKSGVKFQNLHLPLRSYWGRMVI